MNRDEWIAIYDSYANVDFSHLDSAQCAELQDLFSWVGPIFGSFRISAENELITSSTSFLSDIVYLTEFLAINL